jgi:hypothetical protein
MWLIGSHLKFAIGVPADDAALTDLELHIPDATAAAPIQAEPLIKSLLLFIFPYSSLYRITSIIPIR